MARSHIKSDMVRIFKESVKAVDPARLIAENLTLHDNQLRVCDRTFELKNGDLYLIGFGKAVYAMAREVERILGHRLKRGIISVPEGTKKDTPDRNSAIEVLEGARNNLPDDKAENAADRIIELVSSISSDFDKLIVLISGGGSALFPKPKPGVTLEEKLKTINSLTSSGATINELNTVRKKLSRVKGGGLANLSYPVQTISLILSDVLNDPLDIIASGPTVPNSDDGNSAFHVIKKYNLINTIPKCVLKVIVESKPDYDLPVVSNCFPHTENFLIGNNTKALQAAKKCAEECDFEPVLLSNEISGTVDHIADFYKNIVIQMINYTQNQNKKEYVFHMENLFQKYSFMCEESFCHNLLEILQKSSCDINKICIIAGGETTVKMKGNGKGGRSQELALIFSSKISELKSKFSQFFDRYDVMFLSAGTDGIDGPTDVAGAVTDDFILHEAQKQNIDFKKFLEINDSYNFFKEVDNGSALIKTGHTGTNVADIHLLVIYKKNTYD